MSILFSGDFISNANGELSLISKKSLIKKYGQEKFNAIQYHIMLGNANFMFPDCQKVDKTNYEALAHRPFPILCVMGNSDPILGKFHDMPETDIGIGETVYQIQDRPQVAYLKRGKIYTISGIKFLVLGGALTIEKKARREFRGAWYKEEYWSEQEKQDVFKLLETDNQFDFVISHTGPHTINKRIFPYDYPQYFTDEVAFLNDRINEQIRFREWWCAHWLRDEYHFDSETKKGYSYFYRTTKILDKVNGELTAYRGNELLKN
jgi:hypothetical protein